jgi:hypothetical protein
MLGYSHVYHTAMRPVVIAFNESEGKNLVKLEECPKGIF